VAFDCIYKKIRKKRQLYIYVTLQTSLLKQELFVVHVLETSLLKQEFPIKGSIFRAPRNCYEKKDLTVSVNNSTNINKTKESLNSERQQFHQYQQNK
jgi:predicted small secreted protein